MSDKATRRFRTLILSVLVVMILLPATCFTVWRLRVSYAVNRRLAAIRSEGLPANHAETDRWYTAVPDEQNAALVITQALSLIRTYDDDRAKEMGRLKPPMRTNVLSEADRELYSGFVEMNRPALAKAREAFLLPQSRYPIDLAMGVDTPLPHLSKIKQLAMVASTQTVLAGAPEARGEAAEGLTTILQLARSLESDPVLITQLVRMSLLSIAVKTLEYRLNAGAMNVDELSELASEFSAAAATNLAARALVGERAMTIPYFRMSTGEALRRSAEPEEGVEPTTGPMIRGRRPFLVTLTGFFERDQLFFLKTMETNIALAKLPPPGCLASQKLFDEASATATRRYYILSAMTLPSLSRAVVREVKAYAELSLATTAIGIERFRSARGRLPANLGELVPEFLQIMPPDPFDGSSLRYRRLAKGYALHSVDSDGQDDGGRERPERVRPKDKISYDLTFVVER